MPVEGACAIPIIEATEILSDVSAEVEKHTIQVIQSLDQWHEIHETISQETTSLMLDLFEQINAANQGQTALSNCQICHPVEHLIIYNTTRDDQVSAFPLSGIID